MRMRMRMGTNVPLKLGQKLGGGNSNIFYFHPYLGKISNLTNIFQRGWNHQLENLKIDLLLDPKRESQYSFPSTIFQGLYWIFRSGGDGEQLVHRSSWFSFFGGMKKKRQNCIRPSPKFGSFTILPFHVFWRLSCELLTNPDISSRASGFKQAFYILTGWLTKQTYP